MTPASTTGWSIDALQSRGAGIKRQWQERRKYVHSKESDAIVSNAYRLWNSYSNRNAISDAAKRLGWPRWVVTHRGRALGLSKTREAPWTPQEEQIVEDYGFLSVPRLVVKLRKAGYRRTETAIHLKMKRLWVKGSLDGWSARQLAAAFGVDDHKVSVWIKRGLLDAKATGIVVGRNEKVFIARPDVRRFMLNHPEEWDHSKCEKYFLLETISGGKLCEAFKSEAA